MSELAIWWIRRDLRLADNAALCAALEGGARVLPLYIDPLAREPAIATGAASGWWLHRSLAALREALAARGATLCIRRGEAAATLRKVAREAGATRVVWHRVNEPAFDERDQAVATSLYQHGMTVSHFNNGLGFEPGAITTQAGKPFRVFTAYWNARQRHTAPSSPLAAPRRIAGPALPSLALDELGLPARAAWAAGFAQDWIPGEAAARAKLAAFASGRLAGYPNARDCPAEPATSRLSPHLHFGEISARAAATSLGDGAAAEAFRRQLAWREFAVSLLRDNPLSPTQPLDARFADFPWARDYGDALAAWQQGRTGIPLVDAGMRELWHSGWMHNRVRMVVASFLTKNLRIPWTEGARWFEHTLLDADLANNTMGWQWVAGCGADAAPYFRVFNPVRQGERFDPRGAYLRRWVPELAALPDRHLHAPWLAPPETLRQAGIEPGASYPHPLVDLARSREDALSAYAQIRG